MGSISSSLREKRSGGGKLTVGLKQAASACRPTPPRTRSTRRARPSKDFKAVGATCADLDVKAKATTDIVAGDLGESDLTELSPDFPDAG